VSFADHWFIFQLLPPIFRTILNQHLEKQSA